MIVDFAQFILKDVVHPQQIQYMTWLWKRFHLSCRGYFSFRSRFYQQCCRSQNTKNMMLNNTNVLLHTLQLSDFCLDKCFKCIFEVRTSLFQMYISFKTIFKNKSLVTLYFNPLIFLCEKQCKYKFQPIPINQTAFSASVSQFPNNWCSCFLLKTFHCCTCTHLLAVGHGQH